MYKLQIMKNKAYRTAYSGRLSQCFKRLSSVFSRYRIVDENGTVIKAG